MKEVKRNKSTFELPLGRNNNKEKFCHISDNLNHDSDNNAKYLFDFISTKNKIKLQSFFDKKGTKKFLSEKEKAMEKIILFDEINEDKLDKKKTHKTHKETKKKKVKRRSISENAIIRVKPQKKEEKVKNSAKNLKKSTNMVINIDYVEDINNNENKFLNMNKLKKRAIKFNSITSNCSNIKSNEPLNLAMNKDDSFIFSIVSEMSSVKN